MKVGKWGKTVHLTTTTISISGYSWFVCLCNYRHYLAGVIDIVLRMEAVLSLFSSFFHWQNLVVMLPHSSSSSHVIIISFTTKWFITAIILLWNRLVGSVVKASTSREEDPGFESRLRRDFSGVESHQWLKNWHSTGYPAKRLAL